MQRNSQARIESANVAIAEKLREAAELLEDQGGEDFRVRAFRRAADTVADLDEGLSTVFEREGVAGLQALPGIGKGIASAIVEMLVAGRWARLQRLRGDSDPVQLLRRVPGVGPVLAQRIHDELHVDNLEALEVAAHDGRLERVSGVGKRRAAALRATLAGLLGRPRSLRVEPQPAPDMATLLDIDREYRRRAERHELPTIAPKRFNPHAESWLPIMHGERAGWHFTALFSNTARAHQLHRTRDWVVIYYYDGDHREGQSTVVTETHGELRGKRVVRGHEVACMRYYGSQQPVLDRLSPP